VRRYLSGLILLSLTACASTFKYGVGLNGDATFPDPSTKIISVVDQEEFLEGPFDYQWELGTFIDNSNRLGPTVFGSFALGLETKGPGLFASYFVGPALITQTDQRLASIFEFNNNFQIGIRDRRGLSLGVGFQHFSNAGLWAPNIGRDFFIINLTIPLK
jgi:hypothetical protein